MRRVLPPEDKGSFDSIWVREAGTAREVASVKEILEVLSASPPHTPSSAYDAATVAARSAMRGSAPATEARRAFITFAAEAGMLITK